MSTQGPAGDLPDTKEASQVVVHSEAVEPPKGIFASCSFTLAALSDGQDVAYARRIIKSHGGKVCCKIRHPAFELLY